MSKEFLGTSNDDVFLSDMTPYAHKDEDVNFTLKYPLAISDYETEKPRKRLFNFTDGTLEILTQLFGGNKIAKRAISALLLTSTYYQQSAGGFRTANNAWEKYVTDIKTSLYVIAILFIFAFFTLIKNVAKKVETDSYALVAALVIFGVATLWRTNSFEFSFGLSLVICAIGAAFIKFKDFEHLNRLPQITFPIIIGACGIATICLIAVPQICKFLSYGDSAFDMGVFVQMYTYMVEKGTMETTVERNQLLTHLYVHFSPIFYVLLPVYAVFPHVETLILSQIIFVISGIIPLWLIARHKGYSQIGAALIAIAYMTSIVVVSGATYDVHENFFLAPLILWLVFAIERRKSALMLITLVLLLTVKEDAAIYAACIGFYYLFQMKSKGSGSLRKPNQSMKSFDGFLIAAFSVIYFLVVSKFLESNPSGLDFTSSRFSNMMLDSQKSVFGMFFNIFKNPARLFSESFNNDSFMFLIQVLAPLAFIPLFAKKPARLVLLMPFFFINLLPNWAYQHIIGFQYTFGVGAIFFILIIENAKDLPVKIRKFSLVFMAAASLFTFSSIIMNEMFYVERYKADKEKNLSKNAVLDTIPQDASVLADSFLISYLAENHLELYVWHGDYGFEKDTDFRVFENGSGDQRQEMIAKTEQFGYKLWKNDEKSGVLIYINPNSTYAFMLENFNQRA